MTTFITKVPAKFIISGEHFVINGHQAIAGAINLFLTCSAEARSDQIISIKTENSSIPHQIDLQTLNFRNKSSLITYTLATFNEQFPLTKGCSLSIKSDIPIGSGLGSSAALVVAVLKSLLKVTERTLSNDELIALARRCEDFAHGKSSGLDPAVIINGGLTCFQNGKTSVSHKKITAPYYLVHTGRTSSTTAKCVKRAQKVIAENPELLTNFSEIEEADISIESVRKNHALLCQLGVVPDPIQSFAKEIESIGGAFKICGAGSVNGKRGGAGLILSNVNPELVCRKFGYELLDVEIYNYEDNNE